MEFYEISWAFDDLSPEDLRRNHAAMGDWNRWQVLALLWRKECLSQRQLAHKTRLRASTVSNITRDLKELSLIRESGPLEAIRVGPKEYGLEINPDITWAAGLHLDAGGHELCLLNAAGHLIAREHFSPGFAWRELLTLVPQSLDRLVKESRLDPARSAGLGISVPGIVDASRGRVLLARSLEMVDLDLQREFENVLPFPVWIERNVICGACAEHHAGAARQRQSFLYYLVRPGLHGFHQHGLSLVLNGRVLRGCHSASGEMDPLLSPEFQSPAPQHSEQEFDQFYAQCARSLASIVNLIDVGCVIISSDDPSLTEARFRTLVTSVQGGVLPLTDRYVSLLRAQLGTDGMLTGAALLMLQRHLRQMILGRDTTT